MFARAEEVNLSLGIIGSVKVMIMIVIMIMMVMMMAVTIIC